MPHVKKYLSANAMLECARRCFAKEEFKALRASSYSWEDCLMSGLAIFGLKFPSLLKFEQAQNEPMIRRNLQTLYGVKKAPSDTALRERLDQVSPSSLREPFKRIFAQVQRSKYLERYQTLGGYHLLSVDGTGQYSSEKIHCQECCIKQHRGGAISYYHQLLVGAIVHPDERVVIPLAPEPITKQDGATKNDCERNASKRFFADFRREHPHLKVIVLEDALSANHPHLSMLDELNIPYIIGVKPGDHKYLFEWIKAAKPKTFTQGDRAGNRHTYRVTEDVPLSDTHHGYRVTVVEYEQKNPKGKIQKFSWVTRLPINEENAYEFMRAGRSRWKIENETFNTLKNQGYEFEHNYGHGNKHLCSVFSMLMLLAFLIDQVQQGACKLYRAARKKCGALYDLHQKIRVLIQFMVWSDWNQMYKTITSPTHHPPPEIGKL